LRLIAETFLERSLRILLADGSMDWRPAWRRQPSRRQSRKPEGEIPMG
jgi:hypothetical protein